MRQNVDTRRNPEPEEPNQITFMIGLPGDEAEVMDVNTDLVRRFLRTTLPDWEDSCEWASTALRQVLAAPDTPVETRRDGHLITLHILEHPAVIRLAVSPAD